MTIRSIPKRIRVMILDDRALIRAGIRQALTAPDIEIVAEASSAEEAMGIALAIVPDVLLVDIDLPGMSGVDFVWELAPRLAATRMVMLTVSTTEREVFEAITHGAAGYLTKDLTPEALLRAVRSAHEGDLAIPRRMAARLVHRLIETARVAPSPAAGPPSTLTQREQQILYSLDLGLTDRQIATQLTISPRTVETHVSSILRKLGVRNRAEAARHYRERV